MISVHMLSVRDSLDVCLILLGLRNMQPKQEKLLSSMFPRLVERDRDAITSEGKM